MTLDYKILWIDNEERFFKNHRAYIIDYIESKGFDANITEYMSFDEFKENEKLVEDQKKYDLFLIDLNLDHGRTGDEIISEIREHVLTDIIFYSTELRDVRLKINENNIEGIYSTSRNPYDFEEKVTDVIDVTIKKVQDVNNLRGLIMAEVSELDRIKKNIIQNFVIDADSNFKKYIKEKIFSGIKQDLESLNCLVKVEDSELSYEDIDLSELLNNFFYDTFKKSRTVYKIKKTKCNEIDFKHEDYLKDVIAKRNVLAHEEEQVRENGTKYLSYPNGNLLEFNETHCIQIRNDIKKYKKLLVEIEQKLNE
ncbi:hypothetical protein [Halarcobacter sp.]|uniref:hypothetical protein n=1 Tax=Halarcobacter sp. TaxID=2321133 RepID=UPI002AAB96C5|nr:hypothetical protein [Halarcobacter sp.]